MTVRNIPAESFSEFLDSFTRQHHGWLVTITRDGHRLAEDEPLDFARTQNDSIVVSAGNHICRIDQARRIAVTAAGADESAIGHVAISGPRETLTIRFREVIDPELVDGVAP